MPQDKDFKRLVRERMSETGERYTNARSALLSKSEKSWLTPELRELISMLGKSDGADFAYKQLEQLPTETRRAAALEGLSDANWRVRSRCAALLDNLVLTNETTRRLIQLLDDEYPRVRYEALHTLTCEHCKPEKCNVDIRGIAGKLVEDPTPRIRRSAAWLLSRYFDDEAISKLRDLTENDPNERVRRQMLWTLPRALARRKGHEAWLALPPSLRSRLQEKYSGKWVGVADGRVLSAHENDKLVRREVRGMGLSDGAVLCLVNAEHQ